VFTTIDEVEIFEGVQQLTFSFDLAAWGAEGVEPISRAVSNHAASAAPQTPTPHDPRQSSFDITRQLDSMGQGVDAFVERSFVKSQRTPQGL
jgi:hypothetical protein